MNINEDLYFIQTYISYHSSVFNIIYLHSNLLHEEDNIIAGNYLYVSKFKAQNINPDILAKTWKAKWIEYPGTKPNDYGVYHFRKSFVLNEQPQQFIIHVSADNRYKLYVNNTMVCFGPAKGDLYNWNFETIDIAPYLKKGSNIIAAAVWNFGEGKPVWQVSLKQLLYCKAIQKQKKF